MIFIPIRESAGNAGGDEVVVESVRNLGYFRAPHAVAHPDFDIPDADSVVTEIRYREASYIRQRLDFFRELKNPEMILLYWKRAVAEIKRAG